MGASTRAAAQDRRWAEATAIALGGGDPARRCRSRRRRLLWVAALSVGLIVIGLTVGLLAARYTHSHGGHRHRAREVPIWREISGLTLSLAGLVVSVTCIVRLVRSGQWRAAWRAPTVPLDRAQRGELLRQVRGRAPVQANRLPVLTDLARRLQGNDRGPLNPQLLVMVGAALTLAGNAVRSSSSWQLLLILPCVGLYPVALVATRRDAARASTFLTEHPDRARPGT